MLDGYIHKLGNDNGYMTHFVILSSYVGSLFESLVKPRNEFLFRFVDIL